MDKHCVPLRITPGIDTTFRLRLTSFELRSRLGLGRVLGGIWVVLASTGVRGLRPSGQVPAESRSVLHDHKKK